LDSSSKTHSTTDKNWLIRTHQRQILGPVSKSKLIEFVKKGALAPEDEIASGNGYWFSIREKDLLEKYLFGDMPQTFNPISEAKSILSISTNKEQTHSINPNILPARKPSAPTEKRPEEEILLPKDEDLDYPDISNFSYPDAGERVDDDKAPDSTQVVNIDKLAPEKKAEAKPAAAPVTRSTEDDDSYCLPDEADLEYPDMAELMAEDVEEDILELSPKKK